MREAHSGYIMPVGVWNVRENVRNAYRGPCQTFSTLKLALEHIQTRLDIRMKRWMRTSHILSDLKMQRRIEDFLPVDPAECHLGMPFARWYASNGAQGKKPDNPEMLRAFELYRSAAGKKEAERIKIAKDIWKILVEECWVIGTVGLSPAFMGVRIVKNNIGNIPARQTNAQHARTPNTSHPATFFFKS